MTNVIGANRSNGSFNDAKGNEISYDNIQLYVTTDDDENTIGLTASTLKVKYADFEKLTGLTPDAFPSLVGSEIELVYGLVKEKTILKKIRVLESNKHGNTNK